MKKNVNEKEKLKGRKKKKSEKQLFLSALSTSPPSLFKDKKWRRKAWKMRRKRLYGKENRRERERENLRIWNETSSSAENDFLLY